ncbi:hypothetical protein VOLCADRAFT_99426 [Volvox carteri f. nagariensis]|uniref:Fucolectin tachylectin-4 pentraxin-1 domain-containing protein n=1 Tax=Volvox carteri f. nagariensis TaxID=3068 RepID=D8UHS3_VOLCA|nr:uncharacterized protein VOLCADRAFT_99426 [Volvox carteri f. nagariensis]EFJ40733.1 hypothetical protein VOLCADRAFT_99426 [Volvox carteri f. nagariensis]|eukprot:XP_002958199.1 hypothetical protein VOLCADRAFT_99426 [Volvox carteri f. nagariensis]
MQPTETSQKEEWMTMIIWRGCLARLSVLQMQLPLLLPLQVALLCFILLLPPSVAAQGPLPSSPPPPPPPPFTNIAIGKTIYASSQFSSQYAPVNAIDGIIPSAGSNSSTFISANGTGEWLVIDFGEAMTISSIALYHRRDCCGQELVNAEFRLGGAAVLLSDASNYFYNYRLDNASSGPGTTGGVILLNLNPPRTGRTLLVRNSNVNPSPYVRLAMAELQVYGMPAGNNQD